MKNKLSIIIASMLLFACAPSRFVKPLEKDEKAVSVNFGGPMIDNGFPMPLPLTAVTYGHGIDTNLTVFGSLHLTSMAFGNLQLDAGATYSFYQNSNQYIPSVSGSLNGNLIWDIGDNKAKFWPQLDLNAYWEFGKNKSYGYLGVSNWFELSALRSHGQETITHWIYNPQLGAVFNKNSWNYQVELKYLAPNFNNEYTFVPFYSPTNTGTLGFYLTVFKTF